MSDTLNALSQAGMLSGQQQGQSNLLNMLSSAHVANPAADVMAGTQAAGSVVDLRQKQFNLQQAQLQPAYQAMRQIMATNTDPSWGDVQNALAQSARIGGNIDGLVANANETMARGGKPGDFVRATALGGMSPETQGTYVYPQRMNVNTGSNLVYGTTPGLATPNAGQFNPAGSIGLGLSPDAATGLVTINTPQGPVTVTRGSLLGGGGGGGAGGGGGPAGGGGAAPTASLGATNQADFIQKFTPIAQDISQRTGLPVSYVLAQAGLETGWGTSSAAGNNNFFGISPGGQLASYGTPQAGADAYVALMNSPRYASVARTGSPAQIGTAMAAAGYNPNPGYGTRVGNFASALPAQAGGGAPAPGPFIGATTAQPMPGGGGGGGNVQQAGGMQRFDASGQPIGPGGGGYGAGPQIPGVTYTPQGPIIRQTSPYEQPQLEQSSKDYVADQVNNKTLSRRIAPLQSAISIIKENPGLVTGPSSENWYQWVQGLAAGAGIDVGDVHNANAYNELAKQLAMNLQQSGADPSDMARLMHEASQPNTMQGRQAIVTLAAEQIGYQRLKSAQYLEFRSRHPNDANTNAQFYNQETGDWAGQQDPMAYASDLIPQAELQAHLRGLNPDQQRAYVESLQNAKRLFKFKLPTGGQNGG